jgi:hypothetical protein
LNTIRKIHKCLCGTDAHAIPVLLSVLFIVLTLSCEYEFVQPAAMDMNTPVLFTRDIVPIFEENNNCTACHRAGSTNIDLRSQVAYKAIVPMLIDTLQPENSKIYSIPAPGSQGHGFKKYTQVQAVKVLAWVKQGAKNN